MPPRKRQAAPLTPEPSDRRRSTRISTSAQKRSSYFEDADTEAELEGRKGAKRAQTIKGGRRKIEDESDGDGYEDGEEDRDEGEEDKEKKEEEEEEEEEEEDDDDDEDAPPKVTFIPHKKLRETGDVEYADTTVHPNTMLFLQDLYANNRRTWLKGNDGEFRRALKDWQSFVETLTARLIAEADDTVPELPAKDVIYRIYRDTRFSKEPTPYKPHFSAAWSRTGRKGPYACYYVHCQPGGRCMVGGGLWHPEAEAVRLLRTSIDERPQRWRRALAGDAAFRRAFLPASLAADDEAGALQAFAKLNAEGALKTKPKGYLANHRDIELLKLRNFTVMKKVPDAMMTAEDGQDQIVALFQAMSGFVAHLNRIVMPDGEEDSE